MKNNVIHFSAILAALFFVFLMQPQSSFACWYDCGSSSRYNDVYYFDDYSQQTSYGINGQTGVWTPSADDFFVDYNNAYVTDYVVYEPFVTTTNNSFNYGGYGHNDYHYNHGTYGEGFDYGIYEQFDHDYGGFYEDYFDHSYGYNNYSQNRNTISLQSSNDLFFNFANNNSFNMRDMYAHYAY